MDQFFADRLDEDEAAAMAASWQDTWSGDRWQVWGQRADREWVIDDQGREGFTLRKAATADSEGVARHVARQDPARALRRVAADCRLLAAYSSAFGGGGPDYDSGYARGLEDAVRYRLLEWSDHPDYSQEWRP
jgi:Family of unknown function (DUF6221)